MNINKKTLKICSKNPLTGYTRTGYCVHDNMDHGNHYVCAKMDKKFLNFTKKRGNDLSSVVKPGENWCLCQYRWLEAYKKNKAPRVITKATNIKTNKKVQNKIRKHNSKKQFLYNPNNPKKSFDVYINKNPNDTINIKYTTYDDVKNTIKKLEQLYFDKLYSHKRIWQVAMIMKVRLEVIKRYSKTKYRKVKNINKRFNLAYRYFKFLKQRTRLSEDQRRSIFFSI